jgi:hypothetical protein
MEVLAVSVVIARCSRRRRLRCPDGMIYVHIEFGKQM